MIKYFVYFGDYIDCYEISQLYKNWVYGCINFGINEWNKLAKHHKAWMFTYNDHKKV